MSDRARVAPSGFHIMMPPGWKRYTVDVEGKRALVSVLSDRMKEAGRPDLDAQSRTMVESQWRQLEKSRATAVYLPGRRDDDLVMPMSIATRQFVAPRGKDFALALHEFAKVEPERIEVPWGEAFRWTSVQSGRGELAEVRARMLGYGFPLPAAEADDHAVQDEPRGPSEEPGQSGPTGRGILFLSSISYLDETPTELVDGLVAVSDSIMDTFRWRE